MSRCPDCEATIEGAWRACPLCSGILTGEPVASPLPAVPLRYSRRRVLRALFLSSVGIILASFVAQLLFTRTEDGIGVWRSAWLGVAAMWLVVLMAVRKRRNIAKSTVYLVVLVGLVTVYWDYLTGWHGWALTFVVPIVSASAIIALLIAVRVIRMERGDYIVYSGLTVLLGLTPLLFLALGWVTHPLPSAICGALSFLTLLYLRISSGADMRHELAKRLHV